MARYGLSYYGQAYYGPDNPVSFVAGVFTAKPVSYASIELSWSSPTGDWSKMRLVRNPYGFPVNAFDGDVLVAEAKEDDPTFYLDNQDLAEEAFYYYSLFVFDVVSYSWIRSGNVIGLSVKDYNYRNKLYNWLPEITKIEQLYLATAEVNNQDLFKFLSVFGFQLDQTQTLISLLEDRYNLEKVSALLLPPMLNQFGLVFEPEIGFQQARILIRDAIQIGKQKGGADGVREFIKAFTGYAVPQPIAGTPNPSIDGLQVSKNLMLDYNDSSFEESFGHWRTPDASATLSNLKKKKVTSISVTASVTKLTVGTHSYVANQKIYVNGSQYPAFNTGFVTPVTISSVDATAIYIPATITSFPETSAFNPSTENYVEITPYPAPWDEPTTPTLYPNKQSGIFCVRKTGTSPGTAIVDCGGDVPGTKGVPVVAGSQYTFSIYAASQGTNRAVTLSMLWYDRLGNLLSTSTGSATTTTIGDFSARPSVSGSAPASAYYMVPRISIAAATTAATEFHFFDAAQVEQAGAASAFEEARQLKIYPRATRINELTNPHFAAPFTPWSVTDGTPSLSTTTQEPDAEVFNITHLTVNSNEVTLETSVSHDIRTGSNVVITGLGAPYDGVVAVTSSGVNLTDPLRASRTFTFNLTTPNVARTSVSGTVFESGESLLISATASAVQIKSTTSPSDLSEVHYPSTSYAFSVYSQLVTGGTEEVTPSIVWYDSSKNVISTSTGDEFFITSTGTTWQRISLIATAPATAAYAHVQLDWQVIDGSVLVLDSALFENVGVILPYFDGDGGPCDTTDLFWEGTPAASRSHLYKNRFAVQSRLTDELLQGYVTLGTTFAVYLAVAGI